MAHDFFHHRLALALQFPQRIGHAHIGKGQVVPTCGLGLVAVVGAQKGVEVIGAGVTTRSSARPGHQGQVGRVDTEPLFGLTRVNRCLHGVTDFVGGKGQVFRDLLVGQANIAQAVVAHESR